MIKQSSVEIKKDNYRPKSALSHGLVSVGENKRHSNLCNNLTGCNRDDQYLLSSRIVGKGQPGMGPHETQVILILVNPHLEGPQFPALKMEKQ